MQHDPKIAGTVAEKSVAADGKIKLKRSSVHVTDKRKTVQTKTAADGMEYRGRNGGGTVQDRKGNGTTQGRSIATEQGRSSGVTTQGRYEGKTTQGGYADRNTQGRQGKEQEVRQSLNRESRMYAKQTEFASYRRTEAEKEAAVKRKSTVPSAVIPVAAKTTLDEMEGGSNGRHGGRRRTCRDCGGRGCRDCHG